MQGTVAGGGGVRESPGVSRLRSSSIGGVRDQGKQDSIRMHSFNNKSCTGNEGNG